MEKIQLIQDAGSKPLYGQIKDILERDIKAGVYKVNEYIPTEIQLQEMFGVSRMTVRLAIESLVNDGYVVKERAKGTRVIFPKITESLNTITGFRDEMRAKNIEYIIHSIDISVSKANEEIANALKIQRQSNVFCLHRVYYVQDTPLASIYSYLPAGLNLSIDEDTYRDSLYEYLQNEKNIIISKVNETIEVAFANTEVSRDLKISKKAAVLLRTRESIDQNGNNVEYVRSYYRAEKYKYSVSFGI